MSCATERLVIILVVVDILRQCNGASGGILWLATMVVDRMEVRVCVLVYSVSGWKIRPSLMALGGRGARCCDGAMECIMSIAKYG